MQQTSPSPVCPCDDVILTCTVTASATQSEKLFLYLANALDEQNRVFYNAKDTVIVNSSTVGPFTTKLVQVSNDSIVAAATIKGIMYQYITCAGI